MPSTQLHQIEGDSDAATSATWVLQGIQFAVDTINVTTADNGQSFAQAVNGEVRDAVVFIAGSGAAVTGAEICGALSSVVPALGTAVGGVIGGVAVGLLTGYAAGQAYDQTWSPFVENVATAIYDNHIGAGNSVTSVVATTQSHLTSATNAIVSAASNAVTTAENECDDRGQRCNQCRQHHHRRRQE